MPDYSDHLHLHHNFRQDAGNISDDFGCADSALHDGKPRMGTNRQQLPQRFIRAGFSRFFNHDLRRHLRRFGSGYPDGGKRARRNLGNGRLYRTALLRVI